MKIVTIADTHGLHNQLKNIPDGDILIHAGDLTNIGEIDDVIKFNEFLGKLPHRKKIVVAGNHDFCFEKEPGTRDLLTNAIYLEDSEVTIGGIKFYGSPWTPRFGNWAFMLFRCGEQLKYRWDLIPNDTDILITHGPPLGILDTVLPRDENVGCELLIKKVQKVKPKYHIFGYIHS